jgi:hypothetical protein
MRCYVLFRKSMISNIKVKKIINWTSFDYGENLSSMTTSSFKVHSGLPMLHQKHFGDLSAVPVDQNEMNTVSKPLHTSMFQHTFQHTHRKLYRWPFISWVNVKITKFLHVIPIRHCIALHGNPLALQTQFGALRCRGRSRELNHNSYHVHRVIVWQRA